MNIKVLNNILYLDYIKSTNEENNSSIELMLRQLFYSSWFKSESFQDEVKDIINKNNVWIIIEFMITKYDSLTHLMNVTDVIKFASIFEFLISKLFSYFKQSEIDSNELEEYLPKFLKHEYFLKIFLKTLYSLLRKNEKEIYSNFQKYFGAFFMVFFITFIFKS